MCIYNIHIYIYIYIYIYIHTNLPVNVIVRLPHPPSADQETFLAPSADKETRNYDRVLKPPSLPYDTYIYTYIYRYRYRYRYRYIDIYRKQQV